ncbi:YdeI/OmpD-associated family protein [Granulicella arctica]|uniref:YdeI/OmpD-associated family protein n=1 Tax=Granulicella arctica TaxID=940613 RepID=UPI0021E00CE4|nr:YdeI/OmpD-associated family protein [Granulicella arctica]
MRSSTHRAASIILIRVSGPHTLVSMKAPSARSIHDNPAVDAYIDQAKPFAIPILMHLRKLIHKACPEVEESIKWSRPFFSYRGAIICNTSAFNHHCSLGFWGEEIAAVLREADALQSGAMGSVGRITTLSDLPSDKLLLAWLKQAIAFIDSGNYTSPVAARQRVAKPAKSALEPASDFLAALSENGQAATVYAAFSPSCKREYLEWITEAKRPATRAARIVNAVLLIAEGKQRNWKYQN